MIRFFTQKTPQHLFTALFLFLLLASSMAAIIVIQRGVAVATDLRSISPKVIDDPKVERAIADISRHIEQQFYLVLKSSDLDQLEEAKFFLEDYLDEQPPLRFQTQNTNSEQLLDIFRQYRFHLLSNEQMSQLQNTSTEDLLQEAQRRLYSPAAGATLLPLTDDPFGFANDYILQAIDSGDAQEVLSAEFKGVMNYYAPFSFTLLTGAQDFNRQADIIAEINELEATLRGDFPEVAVLRSGIVFFSAEAAGSARADITLISTGSTLGILLLLLGCFRSLRSVLLPLISIAIGVGAAFVWCQLIFREIHIFTIVFGASLVGVVIDYALHYAYYTGKHARQPLGPLHKALALSLLTSVIGYSALSFSGLPVLQQVAVFSCLGLISAWLAVVCLGHFLLPREPKIYDGVLLTVVHRVLAFACRCHKPSVAILFLGILAASAWHYQQNARFGDNPRAFFEADPSLLAQEQELRGLLSPFEPATYLVIGGDSTDSIYQTLEVLFKQHPETEDTLFGIHRFIPSPEQQQQAYESYRPLYGEEGLAAQFFNLIEVEPTFTASIKQDYLDAANHALDPTRVFSSSEEKISLPPLWSQQDQQRYAFFLLTSSQHNAALENFSSQTDKVFFIDTVSRSSESLTQLRESANLLLFTAFALISVLLLLRYRSWGRLGIMLAPISAVVLTLGLLTTLNIPINLFHTMALFLVLGLGMDYVIFVSDLAEQPRDTFSAVALSAITSLLAFGLLSLSSLPVVNAFGLTVLIGNSINVLGAAVIAGYWVSKSVSDTKI